jgi:RNA polymerase sigma-70 factor (ECF subfamily)
MNRKGATVSAVSDTMPVWGGMLSEGRERLAAEPGPADREKRAAWLLSQVADGDRAAFEQLYTLMSPAVFGLALRVLRDRAQAEEVAQEAFLEMWRLAARYDPARGGATAWMLTLAHRRAVDRVRSAQAATERDRRAAAADAATPFDEVVAEVELRVEREGVRQCLETLSAIQRQSVTLAYYEGLSYPEVAARLRVPLGTVKSRMRDGLSRLRTCLESAW